jgi:hypothetical protein
MATTEYPWLPPGTTKEQAEQEAYQLCKRHHRRNCETTAWVDDARIDELRRDRRRSRQAGATWVDDNSIPRAAVFYRVVVVRRVMPKPWEEQWCNIG